MRNAHFCCLGKRRNLSNIHPKASWQLCRAVNRFGMCLSIVLGTILGLPEGLKIQKNEVTLIAAFGIDKGCVKKAFTRPSRSASATQLATLTASQTMIVCKITVRSGGKSLYKSIFIRPRGRGQTSFPPSTLTFTWSNGDKLIWHWYGAASTFAFNVCINAVP